MANVLVDKSNALKQKKKTLWQFIVFSLLSFVTTLVDLGSFSLFNYLIFVPLKTESFHFWVFNYDVAAGGLCAFLAFALSFVISQTFNFFIQRKVTFSANNNLWFSGMMYILMVLFVFFLSLWVPQLFRESLANIVGDNWADFILKNLNMTISFMIQFPMNKWVIMRHKPKIDSLTPPETN